MAIVASSGPSFQAYVLTSPRGPPNLPQVAAPPTAESTARPWIPITRWGWPELVGLAFAHRIALQLWTTSIAVDSVSYLQDARAVRAGDWMQSVTGGLHPLYGLLTGLLTYLTGSVEVSALILSILAGSLIPIPIYFGLRRLWNERVAWMTGFLFSLQPILALDTTEALPTALFLLLFFASLVCGYLAYADRRWFLYPMAGLLAGLCYLTRTEGVLSIGFLAIGAAWVFVRSLRRDPEKSSDGPARVLGGISAGILAIAIVGFPYLLALREVSGRWVFTLKAGQKLIDRATGVKGGDGESDEDGDQGSGLRASGSKTAADSIAETEPVARFMGKKLSKAMFPPLVPLYVLGLLCTRRQGGSWRSLLALPLMALLAFIPSLLLLSLGAHHRPSHRYMLVTGMLLLPWAAAAVLTLADLLSGPPEGSLRQRAALPSLLVLLAVLLPMKSLGPRRAEEATFLEAGRWLAARPLEPNRRVVASERKIAYFGRCDFAYLPSQWTDLNSAPPGLRSLDGAPHLLDDAGAREWARLGHEEFVRSKAALLVVEQRSVDRFFGPRYLKALEALGFREAHVVPGGERPRSWAVWIYSLEKGPR